MTAPPRRPAWPRGRRGAVDGENVERLAAALAAGNGDGVRAELHRGVALVVDSGRWEHDAAESITGRDAVAASLLGLMTSATSVSMASINGGPGIVLIRDGRVVAAVTAQTRVESLSHVWVVCAPDKLRHWSR